MAQAAIRVLSALLCAGLAASPARAAPMLSVCADPANLPYSNDKQQGFENKIAQVLADDLHAHLSYFWFAEHSTFFRRTLLDNVCDVVISVPASLPIVATTRPYFTSSYVAVMRAADKRHFSSFDDPWLKDARIGLQLVGHEGATTAPANALTRRGINQHITAFPMWADDSVANPQGRIVDAVADGGIDVAFVWGPFAGYFARAHAGTLRIEPILRDPAMPEQSYVFPMALGVRPNDIARRDQLQAALDRHGAEIAAILRDDGIPTLPATAGNQAAAPATH